MDVVNAVVKRLGIIKHQLLVFAIIGSIIIFFFAKDLAADDDPATKAAGFHMYYSAVGLLFFGAIFYAYAYLKLPSSEQEGVFEREGKEAVKRHRRKVRAKSAPAQAAPATPVAAPVAHA